MRPENEVGTVDGKTGEGTKFKEILKTAVQKVLKQPDSTLQWGGMIQQQQPSLLEAEQAGIWGLH